MRIHRVRAAVASAVLLALAGVTGCTQQARGAPGDEVTRSAATSDPRAVFLDDGECGTRERRHFRQVPCDSERAVAQVIARHQGRQQDGPRCPARTDFVLRVDDQHQVGYACMRKLRPPHPGDPGRGGGPRTIAQDCVYTARKGQVKETACDGSGQHPPEYRITKIVPKRSGCPADTALYVDVGGSAPVGCARPYRG
ncbi:hypothetical protein [Streptomyces gobiensis]|uniref:hypothetical protein n=1 Tax=Streptomyces gobiensis TaxID=2875706 RepID=UPI001E28AD82|nr:hypothetical protein [Streptomyces gobiensis]UGY91533.1 hypothetical protein test1122_07210 [Streptomyces gobiensis]